MIDDAPEDFTQEERAVLAPHFTDLDGPVFALVNLPETVKGALFARYSRSPKSLRRLFLDEFADHAATGAGSDVGTARAEALYERVFVEYGDDSVAQLGGAHLACERSSQLLAKVLERGRLAAYLEQSTRYVPYDDRPGGRWRYITPDEIEASPHREAYESFADRAFETYARWLDPLQEFYRERFPREPGDSDFVHRMTIRAKACDTLRGLLPAATASNVGIYATGQSYEQLLLRMRSHPLAEVRSYAGLMLRELRKVIPAFLTRVDLPDRGDAWSWYLAGTRGALADRAEALLQGSSGEIWPEVTLTDYDPEGELKVVAACLYEASDVPDLDLVEAARRMGAEDRLSVLRAAVGDRTNRRYRPGRGFERTDYRFDVLCDYGAFRDLQRHRLLTIQWQRLTPDHGHDTPPEVDAAGLAPDWNAVMETGAQVANRLRDAGLADVAQYPVPMAYRIRFAMQMNAREAMHLIELRTTPQGHPAYRRVAQQMHRLIADVAGHRALAAAMKFADHSSVELERLEAERRTDARRRARDLAGDARPGG